METPAKLGVAAVLVGAAGVVTRVQLIAALGHRWDSNIHLAQTHRGGRFHVVSKTTEVLLQQNDLTENFRKILDFINSKSPFFFVMPLASEMFSQIDFLKGIYKN